MVICCIIQCYQNERVRTHIYHTMIILAERFAISLEQASFYGAISTIDFRLYMGGLL
jgi:hypothetical protein